jgi:hypothetical protein
MGILAGAVSCKKETPNLIIYGTVTDSVTGTPVSGYTITLLSQDLQGGTFNTSMQTVTSAVTDANGNYRLVFAKRTSAEYVLNGSYSLYQPYSLSINPDEFNEFPERKQDISVPGKSWVRVTLVNTTPYNSADEITFQYTGGYDNCFVCCNGTPLNYTGTSVNESAKCMVYSGKNITWQAYYTKNGNTFSQSGNVVATLGDTAQILVNY